MEQTVWFTLPGTFLCLHRTWNRKIPMSIIYRRLTNYWTEGPKEVLLTLLSSVLCCDFSYSKVGSLQCLGNAGTRKASNLPSLYRERTSPCLHFQYYHHGSCSYLWYMSRVIIHSHLICPPLTPFVLHSRDCIIALQLLLDHLITIFKTFGGFYYFWTKWNNPQNPKRSLLDS